MQIFFIIFYFKCVLAQSFHEIGCVISILQRRQRLERTQIKFVTDLD